MKTWKNIGILAVSALSLGVVACSGSDGAKGATGDPGAKGDPGDASPASVGVIVPSIGLLDRELDVTITANGVDFTAASPTVDIGAGVTVSNIQVLSATTIYAHLKIDASATTGARDVKVTSGSNNLTSKGGFKVAAAMDFSVKRGKAEQGGVIYYSVDNLDTQHAFDPNAFAVSCDSGLDPLGQNLAVTSTHAEGVLLLAPGAGATANLVAEDDDALGQPYATFANSFAVSPRAPTSATAGTPLTGQVIADPFGTQLYKFSTASAGIWEVTTTDPGAQISPIVTVFGSDGSLANAFNAGGASVVYPTDAASQSTIAVVLDSGFGGGSAADYGFTFSVVKHTGTVYAEPAGAHDTLAHANTNNVKVTALPAASTNNGDIVTGSLTTSTENDWYAVDLNNNDTLEVVVTGGNGVAVDFTDNTGLSYLVFDDPLFGHIDGRPTVAAGSKAPTTTISSDASGNPIANGTFYLHVTGGTGAYSISLRKR